MQCVVDITIERMGEKGDGLSAGQAYPRTLPGETVSAAGKVIAPSPERVAAFCHVFATCGGCKLQHWRSEPYGVWKTELLASALKARRIETEIKPLIDAHGAGRRRISLHVREIDGQWRSGFMAEGSHTLVPINICPILTPKLQDAPEIAAKFGNIFGADAQPIAARRDALRAGLPGGSFNPQRLEQPALQVVEDRLSRRLLHDRRLHVGRRRVVHEVCARLEGHRMR